MFPDLQRRNHSPNTDKKKPRIHTTTNNNSYSPTTITHMKHSTSNNNTVTATSKNVARTTFSFGKNKPKRQRASSEEWTFEQTVSPKSYKMEQIRKRESRGQNVFIEKRVGSSYASMWQQAATSPLLHSPPTQFHTTTTNMTTTTTHDEVNHGSSMSSDQQRQSTVVIQQQEHPTNLIPEDVNNDHTKNGSSPRVLYTDMFELLVGSSELSRIDEQYCIQNIGKKRKLVNINDLIN